MTPSIDEIATWIALEKIETSIYLWPQEYSNPEWQVTLEKKDGGVELRVRVEAETLAKAMLEAYEKWTGTVNGGVPAFRGPLLEAPASHQSAPLDDIPY